MSNAIYFAEVNELRDLGVGDKFILSGSEGHHASAVKRVTITEKIDIVDGSGLRLECIVTDVAKNGVEVHVHSRKVESEIFPKITLVQALAKGDRDEMAIEAATELGIDCVIPWQAERSIVRWKQERSLKNLEKWKSIVRAATKQSRRSWIPQVSSLKELAGVKEIIAQSDCAIILHEDAEIRVSELLTQKSAATLKSLVLIVGPEGGFSQREISEFELAGGQRGILGTSVLRSSTAGPAALVLVNHILNRL